MGSEQGKEQRNDKPQCPFIVDRRGEWWHSAIIDSLQAWQICDLSSIVANYVPIICVCDEIIAYQSENDDVSVPMTYERATTVFDKLEGKTIMPVDCGFFSWVSATHVRDKSIDFKLYDPAGIVAIRYFFTDGVPTSIMACSDDGVTETVNCFNSSVTRSITSRISS